MEEVDFEEVHMHVGYRYVDESIQSIKATLMQECVGYKQEEDRWELQSKILE